MPGLLHVSPGPGGNSRGIDAAKDKARHLETYRETAGVLRDAAATATSHRDTARVLDRLDSLTFTTPVYFHLLALLCLKTY